MSIMVVITLWASSSKHQTITHKTSDHHPQNIRPSPTKHQTIAHKTSDHHLQNIIRPSSPSWWIGVTTYHDCPLPLYKTCAILSFSCCSHGSKWKSHESVIMLGAYSLTPKRHNLMHMIWTSCGNRLQAAHLNIHKLGNKQTWWQPREIIEDNGGKTRSKDEGFGYYGRYGSAILWPWRLSITDSSRWASVYCSRINCTSISAAAAPAAPAGGCTALKLLLIFLENGLLGEESCSVDLKLPILDDCGFFRTKKDDVPLRMLCFARLDCKAEAGDEEEEEQLMERRPWWFKALTSDQTRMIRQGLLRGMENVF